MMNVDAVAAIADRHVRAAIVAGFEAEAPPGVSVAAATEGVVLTGRGIAERWNVDPRLRAISDAIRRAAR